MTDFPDVKLKTLVNFPARASGGTGIEVTKTDGAYTVDLDYSDFAPPVELTSFENKTVLLWDSLTEQYTMVPVSSLSVEGSWTPSLSFTTPGDLVSVFSTAVGRYRKFGNVVDVWFSIITSTFTHTTAAGTLSITGLPFTAAADMFWRGPLRFSGVNKAGGYTQILTSVQPGTTNILLTACGMGLAAGAVDSPDVPSGSSLNLGGSASYLV